MLFLLQSWIGFFQNRLEFPAAISLEHGGGVFKESNFFLGGPAQTFRLEGLMLANIFTKRSATWTD